MLATAALVVWIPGCAVACWWQVGVGRSGDALGWVYAVMWPSFAAFGTVFWWHFVHDDPDSLGRRGLRRLQRASADASGARPGSREGTCDDTIRRAEEADPELAAYNAYLAALARQDRPSGRQSR